MKVRFETTEQPETKRVIIQCIDKATSELMGEIDFGELDKPGFYVHELNVEEKYRRKYVATNLMREAVGYANQLGRKSAVSLHVGIDNEGAIEFYEKSNFFKVTTTNGGGEVEPHYFMVRRLMY